MSIFDHFSRTLLTLEVSAVPSIPSSYVRLFSCKPLNHSMSKDVVNFSLLNQALYPPGASASNQVDDADLFRKALSCCDRFDTKPKEKWARRISARAILC